MSIAPMQLGISTWVWTSPATTAVLETLLPHIASLGFDVIELPIEEVGQFDVARAGELARDHGLGISVCAVIGPGRDLLLPGEAENGVRYLRSCIDVAQQLGSPTVAGPFYSAVGRCWRSTSAERERDVDEIARVLRSLGEYAADRGVVLGVETLNRFETSFLNTTVQALELIDRVDHPAVGVALDLFHLGIEEKHVGDALRTAGRRLVHLQVAENDRGTPGTGHVEWSAVFQAISEIGYDGWLTIETFGSTVKEIASAASIWRDLAPTPDEIAWKGLEFLKANTVRSSAATW